jgi:hypothetical protein
MVQDAAAGSGCSLPVQQRKQIGVIKTHGRTV